MLDIDPQCAKNMNRNDFDFIQPKFQNLLLSEHKTVLSNHYQDQIKTLPLCNLKTSLKSYIYSAVCFLFSDFFSHFKVFKNVRSQVIAVADASLDMIKGCIDDYQNKNRNKNETTDQIYRYFGVSISISLISLATYFGFFISK